MWPEVGRGARQVAIEAQYCPSLMRHQVPRGDVAPSTCAAGEWQLQQDLARMCLAQNLVPLCATPHISVPHEGGLPVVGCSVI